MADVVSLGENTDLILTLYPHTTGSNDIPFPEFGDDSNDTLEEGSSEFINVSEVEYSFQREYLDTIITTELNASSDTDIEAVKWNIIGLMKAISYSNLNSSYVDWFVNQGSWQSAAIRRNFIRTAIGDLRATINVRDDATDTSAYNVSRKAIKDLTLTPHIVGKINLNAFRLEALLKSHNLIPSQKEQ